MTAWHSFVTICRLGSVSATAVELGFTQSAVSRQIAALERDVGVRLLERTARGAEPTAAGEAFRTHALVVLNEADRAVRVARESTVSGVHPLTVGATPSLAANLAPSAVRDLRGTGDHIPWRLVTGLTRELHERLLAGELDIAVVTDAPPGVPEDPRVLRQPIGADAMVVAVPHTHQLAELRQVAIEDLGDEIWAEDNEGSASLLRRHAARHGVDVSIDLVAADLPGKLALAATGHAVALVPGSLTGALRPDVVAVPLTDAPTRGLYALSPSRCPHPSVPNLIPILQEHADPHSLQPTE